MKTFYDFIRAKKFAREKQVERAYGMTEKEQAEVVEKMKSVRPEIRSRPKRVTIDQ